MTTERPSITFRDQTEIISANLAWTSDIESSDSRLPQTYMYHQGHLLPDKFTRFESKHFNIPPRPEQVPPVSSMALFRQHHR